MFSDWDSSLTEPPSSDEDVYVPEPAPKKPRPKAKKEYQITNALRTYRTSTYTAQSLYDQIVDNTVQLDPEYQRDVVWTEGKQVGLIESLFRNFYIPPVIFAVKTHDDGSQTRTCIDGKQRLTSIQLFMDGIIYHRDVQTNKKYWYKGSVGERREVLPKQLIQQFANKQIVCVEYDDITDDQEREIFQRVQLGVALTVAERLQAIPGPWPALIREVQSFVLGDEGFGEDLDWGHDRGRDFQCLAIVIYLIHNHHDPKMTYPSTPKLEKWLSSTTPVPAKTREAVLNVFRIFITLVKDKRYNLPFSKPARVSPVEFMMIGVLIYRYRKTYSMMQLSNAIRRMRADVRSHHADIRQNSKVVATLVRFITSGLNKVDLGSDGEGDTPAYTAIKSYDAGNGAVADKASAKSKDKRRRQEDTESSESEEEEAAPKKRQSLSSGSRVAMKSTGTATAKSKTTEPKKVTTSAASRDADKTSTNAPASTRATKTASAAKVSAAQRPSPSVASQSSATTAKASTTRITKRTTRTAISAAVDSLALSQAGTPSIMDKRTKPRVAPPPAVPDVLAVKQEADPDDKMDEDPPGKSGIGSVNLVPTSGGKTETVSRSPDAMQVDEMSGTLSGPSSATTVRPAAPPKPPSIKIPTPASLPRDTGSRPQSALTPAEQVLQNSLEQILVQHGHLPNASANGQADVSATPPVSRLAGFHISSPVPPPTPPTALPPPPPPPPLPLPLPPGPQAGSASLSMAQRPSLSGQSSYSAGPPLPPITPSGERDRHHDLDWDMDRSKDSDRSWDRERSRGRSPSRDRSRSWDRDRSRNRGRDRSRDPDRSTNRDRSRDRDRYQYRGYGRDRGRGWERDRGGYRGRGNAGDRDRDRRYYERQPSPEYRKRR